MSDTSITTPAFTSTGHTDDDEGFQHYQSDIDSIPESHQVPNSSPDDDPAHNDRWDSDGNYYTWDEKANNGAGGWGVAGHLKDGVDPDGDVNLDTDVDWYTDDQ